LCRGAGAAGWRLMMLGRSMQAKLRGAGDWVEFWLQPDGGATSHCYQYQCNAQYHHHYPPSPSRWLA
jgi:hypothetical protein